MEPNQHEQARRGGREVPHRPRGQARSSAAEAVALESEPFEDCGTADLEPLLDLYSMYTSVRAVLGYLDDVDPDIANVARQPYACLEPWGGDPAEYGLASVRQRFDECSDKVVAMLEDLMRRRLDYREMYYDRRSAWNPRDRHMFETLEALLDEHGDESRAVVWAHNSHLGDAAPRR